ISMRTNGRYRICKVAILIIDKDRFSSFRIELHDVVCTLACSRATSAILLFGIENVAVWQHSEIMMTTWNEVIAKFSAIHAYASERAGGPSKTGVTHPHMFTVV